MLYKSIPISSDLSKTIDFIADHQDVQTSVRLQDRPVTDGGADSYSKLHEHGTRTAFPFDLAVIIVGLRCLAKRHQHEHERWCAVRVPILISQRFTFAPLHGSDATARLKRSGR